MALSDDLRKRVVEAVVSGGLSRQFGGKAFRSRHRERRALGQAIRSDGRTVAEAVGRRSPLWPHRSPSRLPHGADPAHAGHHPAGDPGASDQELRRAFFAFRALALLRPTRRHVQKKTAHATEQQRPDVLKKRLEWFEGQLDLDPDKLVFIDETGTSTNLAAQRRALPARAAVAHRRAARPLQDGYARRRHTPSWAQWRRRPMIVRSTPPSSRNGWKTALFPRFRKVTSLPWTICPPTRGRGSRK